VLVHVLSPVVMPFAAGEMRSPQTYADVQRSIQTYGQKQLDTLVAKAQAGAALF
jgi:hypothetical protein